MSFRERKPVCTITAETDSFHPHLLLILYQNQLVLCIIQWIYSWTFLEMWEAQSNTSALRAV